MDTEEMFNKAFDEQILSLKTLLLFLAKANSDSYCKMLSLPPT